ncbi:MAG: hypothetical protein GYA57_12085 [Myxococcales bacterium]|nr:hypothetical protein [Myxococcales bacterium]
MSGNPLENTPFAGLGRQLGRMWRENLDAWWEALLGDRERLSDLARRLGTFGCAPEAAAGSAPPPEVLQALELMERRIHKLEQRLDELATSVAALVEHLAAGPGSGAGGRKRRRA